MKRTKLLLAGLLLASVQSWGASVTWDYARNITATNEMPNLTVIAAMNAGSGTAVTWEGVTFKGDNGYGTTDFSFSSGPGSLYPGFAAGMTIPKIAGSKKDLLTSGNWDTPDLVVSNLTVGEDYTIQIWTTDSRFDQRYREMTINDGNANTVTLRENVYRVDGSIGQYVLGTFTADSTNQTFTFSQTAGGVSLLNAVVLYSGTATFGSQPTDTTPNDSAALSFDNYARPINGSSDLLSLTVQAATTAGGTSDVTLGGVVFQTDGTSDITVLGTKTTGGLVPGPQGSTDPVVSQAAIDLLDSGRTDTGGIILTGLNNGDTYTVQIWADDSRSGVTYESTVVDTSTRFVRNNMQATENSLGQYQLCKFTANGDTQVIRTGDRVTAVVNAVVVYQGDFTFDTNPPSVLPKEPPSPWRTPEIITGDSDFLNQTVIKAVNVNGASTVTVGSVTFVPDDGSVDGNAYGGFMGNADATWKAAHPNYTPLLANGHYSVHNISLSGLTVGQTYTLQVWVNDARTGIGDHRYAQLVLDGATSDPVQECLNTNYNLGQYVLGVFTADSSSVNISVLGTDTANSGSSGAAAVVPAYALYAGAPAGPNGFDNWVGDYGLSGADAAQDADPDSDGLNNLYEYGLGGDPTNAANKGTSPTYRKLSGEIQYVYPARTDDTDLSYYLEINTDLVYGTWTNSGYTATSGPSGTPDWDSVTNSIQTDVAEKYIRLMITHP